MAWIPYLVIILGVFLLLMIPVLWFKIRTDPMSVLRPIWQDTLTPGFAVFIGILVIVIAFIGGLWAIMTGINLLSRAF